MIVRRSTERGLTDTGWLRSLHTFSFGEYYAPAHLGFRALRVINEDRVQPGKGFETHRHRDMEIISYVLEGELQHRDNIGTSSIIRPGEVQRMSAGNGVTHSEFNPSVDGLVHFLQIWIFPKKRGSRPGYEQKAFPAAGRQGKLKLVASSDGVDGSVTLGQDMRLYAGLIAAGDKLSHTVAAGRHAWVHIARGNLDLSGTRLEASDAAAGSEADPLTLTGVRPSEVLVFDLD